MNCKLNNIAQSTNKEIATFCIAERNYRFEMYLTFDSCPNRHHARCTPIVGVCFSYTDFK